MATALLACTGQAIEVTDASTGPVDAHLATDAEPTADAGPDAAQTPAGGNSKPPSVDLVSHFSTARVENLAYQSRPRSWPALEADLSSGGAGVIETGQRRFQDGSVPNDPGLFVVPPAATEDATKISFPAITLADCRTWTLEMNVGLAQQDGHTAAGVTLSVVVAGTPFRQGAERPSWQVLLRQRIPPGTTQQLSIPLGVWPLRDNFEVALQVSGERGQAGDMLLLEQPTLVPGNQRPELGVQRSGLEFPVLLDGHGDEVPVSQLFDELSHLEAGWLRLPMRDSQGNTIQNFVDRVRRATAQGRKILAVVLSDPEDGGGAPPAHAGEDAFRQLCGWSAGIPRLSDTQLPLYEKRLDNYLQALRAEGLQIDAFEIGNEYDWVCFNGDIPIADASNPGPTISEVAFDDTVSAYAGILEASHRQIRMHNPSATILTFGTANIPDHWPSAENPLASKIAPERFLSALRDVHGVNYLQSYSDAAAVHLYNEDAILEELHANATAAKTRQVWVTEFGVDNTRYRGEARFDRYMDFLSLLNATGDVEVPMALPYAYESARFSFIDPDRNLLPVADIYRAYGPGHRCQW